MAPTMLLVAITVLAAVLRLYQLDFRSLWNDEMASVFMASRATLQAVFEQTKLDPHPPLYTLLLRLSMDWLGDSEWWLRFPSVVAGVLTVPVVYLLGRDLYGHREGLIAALFFAVAKSAVSHAQEARVYALLMLFGALSSWFLLRAFDKSRRASDQLPKADIAGYVMISIVLLYLHYFGAMLVAAQAVVALLWARADRRRLAATLGSFALIGVSYVPWLLVVPSQIGRGSWIPPTNLDRIWNSIEFLGGDTDVGVIVGISLLVLASMRMLLPRSRRKGGDIAAPPTRMLILLLLLPILAALVVSEALVPVIHGRNFSAIFPLALLLVARAATILFTQPRLLAALVVATALGMLWEMAIDGKYYERPYEEFREVALLAKAEMADPQHTALVVCAFPGRYDYYIRRFEIDAAYRTIACNLPELDAGFWDEIRGREIHTVIVISGHRVAADDLIASLRRNFATWKHIQRLRASIHILTTPVIGG